MWRVEQSLAIVPGQESSGRGIWWPELHKRGRYLDTVSFWNFTPSAVIRAIFHV